MPRAQCRAQKYRRNEAPFSHRVVVPHTVRFLLERREVLAL
jgi:hypothetical protein